MMKLLAIDASTDRASVALLTGEDLQTSTLPRQKTHAELLLPEIDKLLVDASLSLNQLDAILFGCGPGSFTGLRIACSITKGLAYAHDLGVIPVGTLVSIAYGVQSQKEYKECPVLAVLDARMQQMYWAYYPKQTLYARPVVSKVEEIQLLSQEPFILAGVGISLYWENIMPPLKSSVVQTLELYPNAANMIHVAKALNLKPISAALAEPIYVRNQVT